MARNVTLGQLKGDIAAQADVVIGTSARYVPSLITRLINQSINRFREKLSNEGAQHFLTSTNGNLTAGATSPWSFGSLDLSAASPAVVRVYSVELNVNSEIRTLDHVPFAARNDYGGPSSTGVPCAWANYKTDKLALMPAPDSTYAYIAWYLPVATDLSADSSTFDGVSGWEDYVTWDVVSRLATKDADTVAFQLIEANKVSIWSDILRNATRVTSAGGAVVGRDTFFSRRMNAHRSLPDP